MSLMDEVLKLYRVDRQVRGLRSRLENAQRYLEAQNRQLQEVDDRLEELRIRKKHVQARIGNLESEGATLDAQLEKFRNDLNTSVTNKQYSAVLTELNTVKAARSKVDDSILAEMEQIESLDATIAEVEAQRAERMKVREVAQTQLAERDQEVGARLSELEDERIQAAHDIPNDKLAIFDEIAELHEGDAMAAVEEVDRRRREYSCGECNMQLPFEQIALLMTGANEFIRCTACGRILYLQDETRGALVKK